MSSWVEIEATFWDDKGSPMLNLDRIIKAGPVGSEGGLSGHEGEGYYFVHGSLRDMTDLADSAAILGWFCKQAEYWCDKAEIRWEFGSSGPRYRYEIEAGELRKLKGVLDL
jgi:hypothetical protein